ncbi:NFX1-type zinc finger-containing protein [Dirofilaria immitis]
MMRSFANMFCQNSLELGLNLVHSPSFLFTRNMVMAQREIEEWCEELESDKNEMLVLFFNDSGTDEVEEKMQGALREKVLLYIQSSDNLLRCARDETEKIIRYWIKEVCERLNRRLHEGREKTDSVKTNDVGAIEYRRLSGSENQKEHQISRDCPLLDFAHIENILSDLQKLKEPLKDLDLVKHIDTSMLHNRLRIPFTDREQNGRLLALLSAALFTELADLQTSVVNFAKTILESGFISFMLRENVFYLRSVASDECHGTLFTYLQDIMHILYIAKLNHIQDFSIAYDEFLYFMELIPEKYWSAIDEGLQLTVFKMLQKLTIASEPLTINLHKDRELNVIDNNMKNFDNPVSLNLVKKCRRQGCKPAWVSTYDVEPPGDFRALQIYATSNDILHPAQPYIRKNIVKGCYLNQEHYLDVQFRLMREDLIGPLRDGIRLWKQQEEKGPQ